MDVMLYRIVRPIIRFLFNILFRPTYKGLDNIPCDGSVVLAGNHTCFLDCLLLISSTDRTIHFLAKDDLVKGLKGIIFKNIGIIPVNRKIHDGEALRSAINVLGEGKVIGIFPEGTINRTDDVIMPFKYGAVKMANASKSKLVCFTIVGKYKLFKKSVNLEYYEGYYVSNMLDDENNKLMNKVRDELIKKKGRC